MSDLVGNPEDRFSQDAAQLFSGKPSGARQTSATRGVPSLPGSAEVHAACLSV